MSVAGYAYDPNADCPVFAEMLMMLFADAEVRRHLLELLGYALQPERWLKVVMIALGMGFNAKTPLLNTLLRKLLGEDGVGLIETHSVEDDRWAAAELVGARVGVDDDLKTGVLFPDKTLKVISQQSRLRGEYKGKDRFDFIVRAVPILIGNSAPYFKDLTTAVRERLQVFWFAPQFNHDLDNSEPDVRAVRLKDYEPTAEEWWTWSDVEVLDLPEKHQGFTKVQADAMWTTILEKELPGILNLLVHHYYQLRQRGHLATPPGCLDAREDMLREGNPVAKFLKEGCERCNPSEPGTAGGEVYEAFSDWYRENYSGGKILGAKAFYARLRELGLRVDVSHGKTKVWGVRLPPEFSPLDKDSVLTALSKDSNEFPRWLREGRIAPENALLPEFSEMIENPTPETVEKFILATLG
jgi:phage/plasmid-associated DNA primase